MSGEELRALAEAAQKGGTQFKDGLHYGFIAAANPRAVLALLDERDALRAQVERVRALHVPTDDQIDCESETYSWDHYRPEQVDSYWIRCSLRGAHDRHEDSTTGLSWPWGPDDLVKPVPQVCDADDERWPCRTRAALDPQ